MSSLAASRLTSDDFRPGAILELAEQGDVFPRTQSVGLTLSQTMSSLAGSRVVSDDFRPGAILELTERGDVFPQAQSLEAFAEQRQAQSSNEQTKTRPRDDMSYFEFAELADLDALEQRQGASAEATASTVSVSAEESSARDFDLDAMSGPLQPHAWELEARAVDEEAAPRLPLPLPSFQVPTSGRQDPAEVRTGASESTSSNACGLGVSAESKRPAEPTPRPPPQPVRARRAWGLGHIAEGQTPVEMSQRRRPPPSPSPRPQMHVQKMPAQERSRNEQPSPPPFRLRISKHAAHGPKYRRVGFEGTSEMGLREEAVAAP